MQNEKYKMLLECGEKTREFLVNKYGSEEALIGKCKEAADLMIKALASRGIKASKHFGWCVLNRCVNTKEEPCVPHCYVLVHHGKSRLYLDCTATQFQFGLDKEVPKVILMPTGCRPYWFRDRKPSIKYMEKNCGY